MNRPLFARGARGIASVLILLLIIVMAPPAAIATAFQSDDVLIAGSDGKILHYRQCTSLGILDTEAGSGYYVNGMCFSTNGEYLYVTSAVGSLSGRISQFDKLGTLLHGIWSPAASSYPGGVYPVSCVADAFGNVYVGLAKDGAGNPGVRKFGPDGSLLATFYPATSANHFRFIDLERDQKTLIYPSGNRIKRFDVANNSQLSDFAELSGLGSGPWTCAALRMRQNGEVMVVAGSASGQSIVLRLDSHGRTIRGYDAKDYQLDRSQVAPFSAVHLSPDETKFWAATSAYGLLLGRFYKIDIETGSLVMFCNVGACSDIVVYREPTAATTECCDGVDNDGDGRIDYPNDPTCTSSAYFSESVRCWRVGNRFFCLFPWIRWLAVILAAGVLGFAGWWVWGRRPKRA